MTLEVAIGEFARLCHLSAKTLRYYHDIDLLVPDAVDETTGHRRYSTRQVGDAHLIRRLRGLDMPLAHALEMDKYMFGLLRDTEDRIEGRKAFQEKRKPQYKGR